MDRFESHFMRCDTATSQAEALAATIAARLASAIVLSGRASIAFSGGSTPTLMLEKLAGHALDWSRVAVTLVDERCVSVDDERSNAGMVHRTLLQNLGSQPEFFPLYVPGESPTKREERLNAFPRPFDVVHLGMGEDAHTASFFPDSDNIAAMLDPRQPSRLMETQSVSSRETRLTWSLTALLESRMLILQLIGARKLAVLSRVLDALSLGRKADDQFFQMPMLAVLTRTQLAEESGVPVQIHLASE